MYKYRKNTIPEALIPEGLQHLIEHDKRKGTAYVQLLRYYLDNERSIVKTIRTAYISRSTFIYQIQKIQEIMQIDLNVPDNRLLLQVILREIEQI